jgi:hypothetical protein
MSKFEMSLASLEKMTTGTKFSVLGEGIHDSVIVGYISREQVWDGVIKSTVELVFQVVSDSENHYLRSKGFTLNLNEKSNFSKLLKGLFKFTDFADLSQKMNKVGLVRDGKMVIDGFIGLPVKLITTVSTASSGRDYASIVSVGEARIPVAIIADTVSEKMLNWDGNTKHIQMSSLISLN